MPLVHIVILLMLGLFMMLPQSAFSQDSDRPACGVQQTRAGLVLSSGTTCAPGALASALRTRLEASGVLRPAGLADPAPSAHSSRPVSPTVPRGNGTGWDEAHPLRRLDGLRDTSDMLARQSGQVRYYGQSR